jgi:hypothetical protein
MIHKMKSDDIMPKRPSLDHIKKELEARRSKVKREFENRIREAEKKAKQYKERVEAQKKTRDAKIAKIEENFSKRADATLKKRLGEEKYKRLQEWLLKKKQEEIQKLQVKISTTGNEDYQRQLAQLEETDPKNLVLSDYFSNKKKFLEEMERDVGWKI